MGCWAGQVGAGFVYGGFHVVCATARSSICNNCVHSSHWVTSASDAICLQPTDEKVEEYAKDVVPVPFDSLYGCSMDCECPRISYRSCIW